ncbi:MAG: D-2-hydroxyacid dehydrogenase [Bacteroidaceae bacterium]|nr:D-2-hydroxyacid dehydrogenase [Bacteroidaceae bacterium]
MRIVVLDGFTLNPGDLSWAAIEKLGETVVYERTRPEEVADRLEGAEIALTNKVVLDAAMLRRLSPTLRYIGVLATGYNVVDVEAARELGICVTNIPAYSTASVAQMVFSHLLNLTNHVAYYTQQAVDEGKWAASQDFCFCDRPLTELAGRTMGLVGLGRIGSAVANIAQAFGMKVVAYTSKRQEELPGYIRKAGMDEIFMQSDVVSLHCPLTEETRYLVDEKRLRMMKKNAILINTGRGPLIDEAAVANALRQGNLGAYAADVLSVEPAQADNPLLSAPRVQLTPHIAWATREARERLMQICALNIAHFIEGNPQNTV